VEPNGNSSKRTYNRRKLIATTGAALGGVPVIAGSGRGQSPTADVNDFGIYLPSDPTDVKTATSYAGESGPFDDPSGIEDNTDGGSTDYDEGNWEHKVGATGKNNFAAVTSFVDFKLDERYNASKAEAELEVDIDYRYSWEIPGNTLPGSKSNQAGAQTEDTSGPDGTTPAGSTQSSGDSQTEVPGEESTTQQWRIFLSLARMGLTWITNGTVSVGATGFVLESEDGEFTRTPQDTPHEILRHSPDSADGYSYEEATFEGYGVGGSFTIEEDKYYRIVLTTVAHSDSYLGGIGMGFERGRGRKDYHDGFEVKRCEISLVDFWDFD